MNRDAAIQELASAVNCAALPIEDYIALAKLVQDNGRLRFGEHFLTVSEVLDIECTEAF